MYRGGEELSDKTSYIYQAELKYEESAPVTKKYIGLQQGVRELPTLSGGEVPDNVRGQDRISQQKNGNLFKMQTQRRTSAREFAENQVNGNFFK